MKVRTSFVTNSSSSSFIYRANFAKAKEWLPEWAKELDESKQKDIINFAFEQGPYSSTMSIEDVVDYGFFDDISADQVKELKEKRPDVYEMLIADKTITDNETGKGMDKKIFDAVISGDPIVTIIIDSEDFGSEPDTPGYFESIYEGY